MDKKNCNFCIYPFKNMLISPDGTALICPKNKSELGNTKVDLVDDIWNSEKFNSVRNDFANNVKVADCQNCWQVESDGGKSLRQYATEVYFRLNTNESVETVLESWHSKKLLMNRFEFALSNTCNLACRHCWPVSSTGLSALKYRPALEVIVWPKRKIENNDELLGAHESFSEETFNKSIAYVSKNVSQVSIVGGEPFLDRRIMSFLESFSAEDRKRVHLTITSNFARPDLIKKSLNYLDNFKRIDVVASIDGSPKVTEYIRTGSEVVKIKESVSLFKDYFHGADSEERLLLCNFAFQALNLLDMATAIRFIVGELGIQTISLLHVHERHMNINILPFEIKQLAKERIMNFILNDFDQLIHPVHQPWYFDTIFNPILKMCDSKERSVVGWNDFIEFTEKFDQASNKSIFDVVPEFKPFWFKLEECEDARK